MLYVLQAIIYIDITDIDITDIDISELVYYKLTVAEFIIINTQITAAYYYSSHWEINCLFDSQIYSAAAKGKQSDDRLYIFK